MKEYLGFIPPALIVAAVAGVAVVSELGYTGHYGGIVLAGFVLLPAIVLATILNLAYLLFVAATRHTYFFDCPSRRRRVVAKCGFIVAVATLFIEAAFLVNGLWLKWRW